MQKFVYVFLLMLFISCKGKNTQANEVGAPIEESNSNNQIPSSKELVMVQETKEEKKEIKNNLTEKKTEEIKEDNTVSEKEEKKENHKFLELKSCLSNKSDKTLVYLSIGRKIGKCRISLGSKSNVCGMYLKVVDNKRVVYWDQYGWPQSIGSPYSTGCVPFSRSIETGSYFGCGSKRGYGEAWDRMGGPENFCSRDPFRNAATYIKDAINHPLDPCDLEKLLEEDKNYFHEMCG